MLVNFVASSLQFTDTVHSHSGRFIATQCRPTCTIMVPWPCIWSTCGCCCYLCDQWWFVTRTVWPAVSASTCILSEFITQYYSRLAERGRVLSPSLSEMKQNFYRLSFNTTCCQTFISVTCASVWSVCHAPNSLTYNRLLLLTSYRYIKVHVLAFVCIISIYAYTVGQFAT